MRQPWVAVATDGIAFSPSLRSLGRAHPRFYGTYPRILGRYRPGGDDSNPGRRGTEDDLNAGPDRGSPRPGDPETRNGGRIWSSSIRRG